MKGLALAIAFLVPSLALGDEPPPTPATPAPTPAPAPTPEKVEWKGGVAAGLIVLSGNSNTTTFTGSANASRETFGWILSTKAAAAYGQNRPTGAPNQVTAYSASGQVRLDRKLGRVWSVFGLGALEADHVANIEYRTAAELGAAAQWVERKEGDWVRLAVRTDLGFRYGYEARFEYYGTPEGPQPGVELMAPRAGLALLYGFSKDVALTEEAEAMPSLVGPSRWLAKSVTKLTSRLSQRLTFGAGYTVAYDSRPAAGKVRTDRTLTSLLEYGF